MRSAALLVLLSGLAWALPDRFDQWDRDGDGKLARDELPPRMRRSFDRIDRDGDGSISRAELEAIGRGRAPEGVEVRRDIPYAGTDNARQKLDLLLPERRKSEKPLPVVAFIHGGGWRNGNKSGGVGRVAPLVATGEYAGVSIGYRLSGEAKWPAQIHDCKAAIRWVKANAKTHNLDPARIAVWGTSAGGHLVAMLGVSGGVKELEGDLGPHEGVDSRVACVVDFFGPADFMAMARRDSPRSAVSLLLGGTVAELPELAKQASPVTHASRDDAPILILHGTNDRVVPYDQSVRFLAALKKAGVDAVLVPVEGAGHGFRGKEIDARVRRFLAARLLGKRT